MDQSSKARGALSRTASVLAQAGDAGEARGAPPVELFRIQHLTKQFDGVTVLDDVSLSLLQGEVHGLAGHNGSGKSTLIKCLSGFHQPTGAWNLQAGGRHLNRPLQPGEAAQLGLTFVHQDRGLLPELTVLENLLLFRMGSDRQPYIAWRREQAWARELFATFGISLDPRAPLASLRPVEQAQVAIVRAIAQLHELHSRRPELRGVLVLDEATTFLDRPGRSVLHALIRRISSEGDGLLFVSHDISELLAVTDRITVLRNGRVVGTVASRAASHAELVALILSERTDPKLDGHDRQQPAASSEAVSSPEPGDRLGTMELRIDNLGGDFLHRVDLVAREGEILGLTGIVGGGWELVPEFVFGSRRATHGTVQLGEELYPAHAASPSRSLRAGMVYVPPDRQRQGIVGQLSVQENVMLPVLGHLFRRGHLQFTRIRQRCRELLRLHAVHPNRPDALIASLSGGNQQKAVLAKWLQLAPKVVLLNEPTQGVDIGARRLIIEDIQRLTAGGTIVLYASGDWDEVAGIADRVVIVADGEVAGTLERAEITEDAIARVAYRGTQQRSDARDGGDIWELIQ